MVCLQSRGLLPAGAAQYAAAVTRPGPVLWPGAEHRGAALLLRWFGAA